MHPTSAPARGCSKWLVCAIGLAAATLLLLNALACRPQSRIDPQLDAFAEAFRSANQAPDVSSMLELYAHEGSDPRHLSSLKSALQDELGLPIQSIEFQPLTGAPDEQIDFSHNGIVYGPTLTPQLRMQVHYATADEFTSRFTLGRTTAGEWRILCARPLPAAVSAGPE